MKIKEFIDRKDDLLIVDTRTRDAFINGFIPGSIFLPPAKFSIGSTLLQSDKDIIIIAENGDEEDMLAQAKQANIGHVIGYLEGGVAAWNEEQWQRDILIDIDADEFALDVKFDKSIQTIDVRSQDTYTDAHISGANNIPLDQFADIMQIASLDENKNIYVYCGGGNSAVVAASLMKHHGFHNVRVVTDGFEKISKQEGVQIQEAKSK